MKEQQTKQKQLQIAAVAYVIAGLGFLYFGFPFWFLHAVDEKPAGHLIAPFVFVLNDLSGTVVQSWYLIVTSIALFIGALYLFKAAEPTGNGSMRKFLYVSMAGAASYFLGTWILLPFLPLGALLNAVGMLLVSVACFKKGLWTGSKRFTPLLVGCFPFLFMYPLLIITGHRPAFMIGFWGIPWMLLGIAAWMRSKEI